MKDKEEKRRLGRMRVAESRARRRAYAEFHARDFAVEVSSPCSAFETEEKEPDDLVALEDM